MESLQVEIDETEKFINVATFEGIKIALQAHAAKLKKALDLKKAKEAAEIAAVSQVPSSSVATTVPTKSAASISAGLTFIPVETYSWDQGEYNSPTVSIFVDLDGVGSVKDQVNVTFTKASFDLSVTGLDGKNYRLVKDNLEKDIIPNESTFIVKKNKVVIKLRKVKGEYSYEHWSQLTAKKKREETDNTKKDPMGGIMDMMKNMYDEGDENMKKIIGEAMLKSQRGEKAGPPGGIGGMDMMNNDF